MLSALPTAWSQTPFWNTTATLENQNVWVLRIVDDSTIVAGSDTTVFTSLDLSATWHHGTGLGPFRTHALAQTPDRTLFSGTLNGRVYKSNDRGSAWVQANTGWIAVGVFALASDETGRLFAGNSGIFHTTNAGQEWSYSSPTGSPIVYGLASFPPQLVLAGTSNVGVFRSTNGGQSWAPTTGEFSGVIVRSFTKDSAGTIYATAGAGVAFSTDNGQTWTSISAGLPSSNVFSVAANSNNHVFAATSDSGVFRLKNRRRNWEPVRTGNPTLATTSLAMDKDEFLFVGSLPGVRRSNSSTTLFSSTADSVSFGRIDVGSHASDSVLVRNHGTEVLSITGVSGIPDWAQIVPNEAAIPVGTAQWFHVVVSPDTPRVLHGSMYFISNANTSPDELTLHAIGNTSLLAFAHDSVTSDTTKIGMSDTMILRIHNIGTDTLVVLNISTSDTVFRVTPGQGDILPGQFRDDTLIYNPSSRGPHVGYVRYVSDSYRSPDSVRVIGHTTPPTSASSLEWIASEFTLFQNYPNPFNPSTRIRIGVDRPTWLTIRIFNLLGQHVATLIDGPVGPGEHAIDWQAEGFPAGTYMCRMIVGTTVRSIRLVLIK